jgi:hypothetical protein
MQNCFSFEADHAKLGGMAVVRFTAVHVRSFLGLTRTEFQRWTSALPPFTQVQTQERNAREFSVRDLAFFAAVDLVHRRLGVPLRSITRHSAELYRHFQSQPLVGASRLHIHLVFDELGNCSLAENVTGELALSIDTASIWQSVHRFVGIEEHDDLQRDLPFGLAAVDAKAPGRRHG